MAAGVQGAGPRRQSALASTCTRDKICEQTVKKVHDMCFFSGCREYTYIDTYLYPIHSVAFCFAAPRVNIFFPRSPRQKKRKKKVKTVIHVSDCLNKLSAS